MSSGSTTSSESKRRKVVSSSSSSIEDKVPAETRVGVLYDFLRVKQKASVGTVNRHLHGQMQPILQKQRNAMEKPFNDYFQLLQQKVREIYTLLAPYEANPHRDTPNAIIHQITAIINDTLTPAFKPLLRLPQNFLMTDGWTPLHKMVSIMNDLKKENPEFFMYLDNDYELFWYDVEDLVKNKSHKPSLTMVSRKIQHPSLFSLLLDISSGSGFGAVFKRGIIVTEEDLAKALKMKDDIDADEIKTIIKHTKKQVIKQRYPFRWNAVIEGQNLAQIVDQYRIQPMLAQEEIQKKHDPEWIQEYRMYSELIIYIHQH